MILYALSVILSVYIIFSLFIMIIKWLERGKWILTQNISNLRDIQGITNLLNQNWFDISDSVMIECIYSAYSIAFDY